MGLAGGLPGSFGRLGCLPGPCYPPALLSEEHEGGGPGQDLGSALKEQYGHVYIYIYIAILEKIEGTMQ